MVLMGMFGLMCKCGHNSFGHGEGLITGKHPCQVEGCGCTEFEEGF